MKLNEIYYKVELKIDYPTHVHVQKDIFNDLACAEQRFKEQFAITETGFLSSIFTRYTLALAEVHPEEKRQTVIKYRQAPI